MSGKKKKTWRRHLALPCLLFACGCGFTMPQQGEEESIKEVMRDARFARK